jgi:SAM-dependent methyltransferase
MSGLHRVREPGGDRGEEAASSAGSALVVSSTHPWIDEEIARLYDVFPFDRDLGRYLELAADAADPVLECACGTGRVMLPLARAGHRVVGLDRSPHMLGLAREKLRSAGDRALASRVRLVQADMRSFELGQRFGLAVVAARSFGHLLDANDQLTALRAIHDHLEPGAALALDLLNPSPAWLNEPVARPTLDLSSQTPDGRVVNRMVSVIATDIGSQVRVLRSEYEIVAPDGSMRKRIVEWPLRWTHRYEIEHLLERAGFALESVEGGYEREQFHGEGTVMLVVARRRGR